MGATEDIEAEITDAMVAAGKTAYHDWDSRFEEPEGLVIAVYEAMRKAQIDAANEARAIIREVPPK